MTAVALYTLREMSRRRLLWAFVGVAVLLMIALGIAPFVIPGTPTGEERSLFLLNTVSSVTSPFALISAIAIGMTVIYHDLESGTVISIFSKPLTRLEYASGKVIAGLVALVAIMAGLALTGIGVLLVNGGGHEIVLTTQFLAFTANFVIILLIVMTFTTFMNNIVAAVVGFVVVQVTAVIDFLHTLVVNHVITNDTAAPLIKVAYWLVPHQLTSDLPREIVRTSLRLRPPPAGVQGRGFDPLSTIPGPSGLNDILFWAAYLVVLAALLYVSVRRRQV